MSATVYMQMYDINEYARVRLCTLRERVFSDIAPEVASRELPPGVALCNECGTQLTAVSGDAPRWWHA